MHLMAFIYHNFISRIKPYINETCYNIIVYMILYDMMPYMIYDMIYDVYDIM